MSFYDSSLLNKGHLPSERDKRRLFWRDDMENYKVSKWSLEETGTLLRYINSSIPAFEGDYVLDCYNPDANLCAVKAEFGPFNRSQKHSVECRWYIPSGTQITTIGIIQYLGMLDPAGDVLTAFAQYVFSQQRWRVWIPGGAVASIERSLEPLDPETWNYLKVIVDWPNKTYDKLVTNSLDSDISIHSLWQRTWAVGTYQGVYRLVLWMSTDNPGDHVYFDDVRIYLNEE